MLHDDMNEWLDILSNALTKVVTDSSQLLAQDIWQAIATTDTP